MTDFTEPHQPQYQVQAMQDTFQVWRTIEKHDNPTDAEDCAEKYAEKNPDAELQIVRVQNFNY